VNQSEPDENRRAVIYARVSTDEQAAKGYSLPTQIEACEKYARDHGFEVADIFQDDYTGTTPIEQRPEGRKAYDLLRHGAADVLIAYRIDRIVRPPEDGDEWDMPVLIRGLAKLGREIHVCNRGQLKTDFASLLIAMLDARKAGEERRDIIERTTRGRNGKAQEGKVIGTGIHPYGYRYEDNKFEIIETEAVIVRMIYQWYISGDDENHAPMTDYAITRRLSTLGIPTPGESRGGNPRIRESGMWAFGTVRRILTSETYAGKYRWGRVGASDKNGKRLIKLADELFVFDVPPIVSRDVWEAAQARREHNKRISGTKRYLLRGMITCGCGRKMAGQVKQPRIRYRCSCYRTYLPGIENYRDDCREKSVNGDVLETVVWNYVMDILTDPVQFEAEWRKAQETEQQSLAPKRERLETIHELIKHCEQEASETAAALKKAKGLVLAKLQAEMDTIDERYSKLTAERDRLSVALKAASRLNDEALTRALQFRTDVIKGLKNPTFDDKRLYLELLQVQVIVKDGQAVISCALPIQPLEVNLSEDRLTSVLHSI
jgi:site-specific DNA recombinase